MNELYKRCGSSPRATIHRRRLLLSLGLLFTLTVLTGCARPWQVLVQAVPNPMLGQRRFAAQGMRFEGLRVGNLPEGAYLARKSPEQRQSWATDKQEMNNRFFAGFKESCEEEGLDCGLPSNGAAFSVGVQVLFVEPGVFTAVLNIDTGVSVRARVIDAQGTLVDEFQFSVRVPATLFAAASGTRLRQAGFRIGQLVARYLAERALE